MRPTSDAEALEITGRASEIIKNWERPIIIETDLTFAIGLIGVVQLALRHPAMAQSQTGHMAHRFIADLIHQIDPSHGDVWDFLMMGFDEKWDALAEYLAG